MAPFLAGATQVIKASSPPASADEISQRLSVIDSLRGYADWAGGLLWLGVATPNPALISEVRAFGTGVGHPTLVKAPAEVRSQVDVFQPQPAPLARLTGRINDSFDPSRVLNPGRMYAGA